MDDAATMTLFDNRQQAGLIQDRKQIGMLIFALNTSAALGENVAAHLSLALARHEERDFEDGEHKIRPLENVRGRDVFVIQSLYGERVQSVNDKLCRLLFFAGALHDAGAGRITAVIPYFAYARKDRKTKARDPVTMKYMARLLEASGVDHVVGLDIHNPAAYQNAFRIPTEHLEAHGIFAAYLKSRMGDASVVVVSPDTGGIKRAEAFRARLARVLGREVDTAFMEKQRSEGVVSGETLVGKVRGRTAVIVDDIISSGATLSRAVSALAQQGASRILAAASHGIFVKDAAKCLAHPQLSEILVTDSIPPFRLDGSPVRHKLTVVSAAALLAQTIKRMHEGGSVCDLLEEFPGSAKDSLG